MRYQWTEGNKKEGKMGERVTKIDTWLTFQAKKLSDWWTLTTNLPDDILIQILLGVAGIAALILLFVVRDYLCAFALVGIFMSHQRGRATHAVALEAKTLEVLGVSKSLSWIPLFVFQLLLAFGLYCVTKGVLQTVGYFEGQDIDIIKIIGTFSYGICTSSWMVAHFMLRTPPSEKLKVRQKVMVPSAIPA
jgi:hypothetical protein